MSGISPIFLEPREAFSVDAIAGLCGGHTVAGTSAPSPVSVLSSLANPKAGSLTFVQPGSKSGDTERLESVGVILCAEQTLAALPASPAKIVVASPQTAFVKVAVDMFPESLGPARVSASKGMNRDYPAASVSSLAVIEDGAVIEAGAAIGDHAAVGRGTVIGANAVIADRCQIGRECRIGPGAVLQYALVGDGVIIHSGVQIGAEGFGFLPGLDGLLKVPQLGRVILQNHVEIGANTTVDRGAIDDTVIGESTKIDNLVQIAHNVWIGRNCVIAAQTGISGSVRMGDECMLGGGVGISDHVTIGSRVQIAASSGVMSNIPDGERWAGTPARPFKEFFREMATLRKLVSADKKPKTET